MGCGHALFKEEMGYGLRRLGPGRVEQVEVGIAVEDVCKLGGRHIFKGHLVFENFLLDFLPELRFPA